MTRPMPGPPDPMPHEDSARPHDSAAAPWNYCSGCAAENRLRLADPKRLTDAECAAEYWRAEAHFLLDLHGYEYEWDTVPADHNFVKWLETCVRFDTCPHALEEA